MKNISTLSARPLPTPNPSSSRLVLLSHQRHDHVAFGFLYEKFYPELGELTNKELKDLLQKLLIENLTPGTTEETEPGPVEVSRWPPTALHPHQPAVPPQLQVREIRTD